MLFGDWQICFQTYADLYNILPDDRRIKRAREVMEYEMSTPQSDYWWWADGLYMVMPVMTKLNKITGNKKYLDKLYEYVLVSDSIMYDPEEGLYYRDAKYVNPISSLELGVSFVIINCIYLSFMQIHAYFYFNYIIYSGLLIFCVLRYSL